MEFLLEKIEKILADYDSKPTVELKHDGVYLKGGSFNSRLAVENYIKHNKIFTGVAIANEPTAKRIYFELKK